SANQKRQKTYCQNAGFHQHRNTFIYTESIEPLKHELHFETQNSTTEYLAWTQPATEVNSFMRPEIGGD
ncbi:MAG TPA: hypothetical protein PLR25_29980, partial [Planctomycetaceae bacterium]|nr:hypothetical protein [Planctomycetaceae bacterium]